MLLKSFTIFAALLFLYSVLPFGAAARALHDSAIAMVGHRPDQAPEPRHARDSRVEEKPRLRHAILRNGDIEAKRNDNDSSGAPRAALRRRLPPQPMT